MFLTQLSSPSPLCTSCAPPRPALQLDFIMGGGKKKKDKQEKKEKKKKEKKGKKGKKGADVVAEEAPPEDAQVPGEAERGARDRWSEATAAYRLPL